MAYTDGEALVLARLREVNDFSSQNTSIAKYKMLDSGKSDHYGILHQGGGENGNEFISGRIVSRSYTTVIEVWQSYRTDGTDYIALVGYMEGILDKFDAYHKLGDTAGLIGHSQCKRWDEPEEMWKKGNEGPRWLRQKFYVEWTEENIVTLAE